jgi:hypothetical protein
MTPERFRLLVGLAARGSSGKAVRESDDEAEDSDPDSGFKGGEPMASGDNRHHEGSGEETLPGQRVRLLSAQSFQEHAVLIAPGARAVGWASVPE